VLVNATIIAGGYAVDFASVIRSPGLSAIFKTSISIPEYGQRLKDKDIAIQPKTSLSGATCGICTCS
jgi:hypothetical protein